MMTDPIADMLTRIRNALRVRKEKISMPYSGMKFEIANILASQGYILGVGRVEEPKKELSITLKYLPNRRPAISHIKRISKPGQRIHVSKNEIPKILNDYGIAILSTSQGLLTNKEARKRGVGGEIVCELY